MPWRRARWRPIRISPPPPSTSRPTWTRTGCSGGSIGRCGAAPRSCTPPRRACRPTSGSSTARWRRGGGGRARRARRGPHHRRAGPDPRPRHRHLPAGPAGVAGMNDRERILRESLADWRAQGLLSGEQPDRLLASVVAPRASPGALAQERKLGRGVAILINLGALVLAAGLLVFFASHWIEFGRAAKIASR